jgi:hypothetical protein
MAPCVYVGCDRVIDFIRRRWRRRYEWRCLEAVLRGINQNSRDLLVWRAAQEVRFWGDGRCVYRFIKGVAEVLVFCFVERDGPTQRMTSLTSKRPEADVDRPFGGQHSPSGLSPRDGGLEVTGEEAAGLGFSDP